MLVAEAYSCCAALGYLLNVTAVTSASRRRSQSSGFGRRISYIVNEPELVRQRRRQQERPIFPEVVRRDPRHIAQRLELYWPTAWLSSRKLRRDTVFFPIAKKVENFLTDDYRRLRSGHDLKASIG